MANGRSTPRFGSARIIAILAALLVVGALESSAQSVPAVPAGCPGFDEKRPTLAMAAPNDGWIIDRPPQSGRSPVQESYLNFRGLLIEENHVREIYPFLPYVFFDAGSAQIPNRYTMFASPGDAVGFDDARIPGGTLEKHRHLLNILGYRLRKFPALRIGLIGHDSHQPELGETSRIARERVREVARYLREVWKIDSARIRILPSAGRPWHASNPRDSIANSENRRVEITSLDWEIIRPIMQEDFRRVSDPGDVLFTMGNGVADGLVAHRRIEIDRNGRRWHTLVDIGVRDTLGVPYNWGAGGDENALPSDESPYVATLVVVLKDGRECRSLPLEIPVLIVTNEVKRRERLVDETRDIYSVILFNFGKSSLGPIGARIIRELILSDLRQGARIVVTGYSSREENALELSEDRAKAVSWLVRKLAPASVVTSLDVAGVGDEAPLYTNDLPEGRALNRTVQVRIVTPSGPAGR